MNKSLVLLMAGLLAAGGIALSTFVYFSQSASTESDDAPSGNKAPSIDEITDAAPASYPNIFTCVTHNDESKYKSSKAETIICPLLFHLPLHISLLNRKVLPNSNLRNQFNAIASNYEQEDCNLVELVGENNNEFEYVSAQDDSIVAFFQLVSSKVIDVLCYQKASNARSVSSGNCDDLYLSDESGHFKNFLTVYYEKANDELGELILTVEEWENVQQLLNALVPDTVLHGIEANKRLLHKLVFSRNIYALVLPLFEFTPEPVATEGPSIHGSTEENIESTSGSDEAADDDSVQKVFNLVALFHNITNDPTVLRPDDKMHYFLLASLLYPFSLHYKEFDKLQDLEVIASCCRSLAEDKNVRLTYLFRWEEIGLPQGYEDNYYLFCYRTIYEITRPLIESIRRSNPERADVYTREFESIQLVDNFDPSSDIGVLDRFFKSLKRNPKFTPQANLMLFFTGDRFGYIRPSAQEQ